MTTRRDFLKTAAIMPLTPQSIFAGKGRLMDEFLTLEERRASPAAPRYLDRGLEDWLRTFLDAERPDQTSEPCQALPCFGPSLIEPALQVIPSVEEWKQARLIECIAETGKPAVPALVGLIETPSAVVRAAACRGLGRAFDPMFNASAIVAKSLTNILRISASLTWEGWRKAFVELEAAEQQADACLLAGPEIIAAAIAKTRDADVGVRIAAVQALGDLNCEERLQGAVFHAVVSGLTDPEPDVRGTAGASLYLLMIGRQLPTPRDDDVRTLVRALDDPDPYVAGPVREVLHVLPGGPYVQDADPVASAQNLGCINDDKPDRLESGNAERREAAAPSAEVIRSLQERLSARLAEERVSALEAVGKVGRAASMMEVAVSQALSDPDIAVRIAASRTLRRLGTTSTNAAYALLRALEDSCQAVAASAQLSLQILLVRLSGTAPGKPTDRPSSPTDPET